MNNYGVIVRKLRKLKQMNIQSTAAILNRSVGWLSSIESGDGRCRITESEFNSTVTALGGNEYRPMFKTWVAQAVKSKVGSVNTEGAILRYIRLRKKLSVLQAAQLIGYSSGYLCKLEQGEKPLTKQTRIRVMKAYGYSPGSFKNFVTDPNRTKSIPPLLKLDILLKQLNEDQLRTVEAYIQEFILNSNVLQEAV